MLFLFFSNINLKFGIRKFTRSIYTIAKAMSTTRLVKLINQYKFAKAVLDENFNTFLVYIAILEVSKSVPIMIHFSLVA